jgi:hypothetical protein
MKEIEILKKTKTRRKSRRRNCSGVAAARETK